MFKAARNVQTLHCGQANDRSNQEQFTWSKRLSIILLGTLLLFSAFFSLEFLVAKLAYGHEQRRSHLQWPQCPLLKESHEYQHNDSSGVLIEHVRAESKSKLGVDFELIYEQDLELNERATHFKRKLESNDHHHQDELLVKPELKLDQLLAAYHVAMPFNPDIWRLSEPARQLHLLSGDALECSVKLKLLIEQLEERVINSDPKPPLHRVGIQQYNLMRLLDAQGRPEAGTLLGHPFWLGSYIQCQRLSSRAASHQLIELARGQLETRYCVGKLSFKSWISRRKPSAELSSIKVGLCLPVECDSLELFKVLDNNSDQKTSENIKRLVKRLIEFNLNERIYPSNSMELVDIFCLPLKHKRTLNFAAHLLIGSIAGWLVLMITCTYLRKRGLRHSRVPAELLEIMAIDVNLIKFFTTTKQDTIQAKINLNVLDSVKHTGSACIILAHVLLGYLTLGSSYSHTIETLGRDMRTLMLLSLNNIVDTFFVISGLLASYLTLSKATGSAAVDRKQSSGLASYLNIALRRYLRMAPLYLFVYGFIKLLSVHLGEGPLWDYATNGDSMRGQCAGESWWWAVMMASDLKPITQHCVPAAWSLAVDLQFFLLALPLFISGLASRRPLLRRLTCLVIMMLIIASTALTWHEYKSIMAYVSARDFAKLRLHVFTVLIRYAAHAYSQPQNRVGPILIGLLGGYLLFRYSKRQDEVKSWPFWMRGKWFTCALLTCALTILAPCMVELRERARQSIGHAGDSWPNQLIVALLALNSSPSADCNFAMGGFVLIKPIWSACNLIILLRLITDLNQTTLARLMSGPFWQVISRLNYALLLIHFEVIAYELMSRHSHADQPITWVYLSGKFAYAYLFSLAIAFPLCVLFEQPSHRLISWLIWGGKMSRENGRLEQKEAN